MVRILLIVVMLVVFATLALSVSGGLIITDIYSQDYLKNGQEITTRDQTREAQANFLGQLSLLCGIMAIGILVVVSKLDE